MRTAFGGFLVLLAASLASAAAAGQCGPRRGIPGHFDYYLLSLSWAPSYCATPSGKANQQECGSSASHGFVVHGLWPQYADGGWPQCCQGVAPVRSSPTIDKVARVMVGSNLMEHEWQKHGSCVTTQQDNYFGRIDEVATKLGLAPKLDSTGPDRISVSDLKRHWPVPPQAISPQCKGKRLTGIHICLDKAMTPIACPDAEVKADNCPGTVSLR